MLLLLGTGLTISPARGSIPCGELPIGLPCGLRRIYIACTDDEFAVSLGHGLKPCSPDVAQVRPVELFDAACLKLLAWHALPGLGRWRR